MTNGNIVQWVVEEVDALTKIRRTQAFNNYDEALDVYNNLKTINENNFVSIQKSEKKLLTE